MEKLGEKDTLDQKLEELSLALNKSIIEFDDNYFKSDETEKFLLLKVQYF